VLVRPSERYIEEKQIKLKISNTAHNGKNGNYIDGFFGSDRAICNHCAVMAA